MKKPRVRVIPPVRDPALELSLVREIGMSTNDGREEAVKTTAGEPTITFEGKSNPFIDYHRNDLLLSTQHMRSEGHDEMVFILMTQCKELTFKALHYEAYNMQLRIQDDDLAGAMVLVPRIKRLFEYLIKTWDVLSTITSAEFNKFRDCLGVSSGQQSYMYRHVEFILATNPGVWRKPTKTTRMFIRFCCSRSTRAACTTMCWRSCIGAAFPCRNVRCNATGAKPTSPMWMSKTPGSPCILTPNRTMGFTCWERA